MLARQSCNRHLDGGILFESRPDLQITALTRRKSIALSLVMDETIEITERPVVPGIRLRTALAVDHGVRDPGEMSGRRPNSCALPCARLK